MTQSNLETHNNNKSYDRPARIGLIGCGLIARGTHIPNVLRTDTCKLEWLCDIDEEALKLAAEMAPDARTTTNYVDVCADPSVDLVLIATSQRFRIPLFEAAAANSKPVYCEKPLAGTLEECRQAVKIIEAADIPFCIGHNRRCSPAMEEAREIIHKHRQDKTSPAWRFDRPGHEQIDTCGQDNAATMLYRVNDDWHSWKAQHLVEDDKTIRHASILNEMTHFFDLALWFLQSPATHVMALGQGPLSHTVSIMFEDQSQCTVVCGANGTFAYPKELMEIIVNGGMLAVDHMLELRTAGIKGAPLCKTYPVRNDHWETIQSSGLIGWLEKKAQACEDAATNKDPNIQLRALRANKGHALMLQEFIREIRGKRSPITSVRDGYEAARICFAAIRSLQEERVIDLTTELKT